MQRILLFLSLAVSFLLCASFGRPLQTPLQRHQASVIGPVDRRGSLTVRGPDLGLSAAEIEQLRASTGYVYCPGTGAKDSEKVSGFLIAPDVVVTVAHVFLRLQGGTREPLAGCIFQNQATQAVYAGFRWGADDFRFGTSEPGADGNNDYAIIRLAAPIPGAVPLRLAAEDVKLVFAGLIPVSAFQSDLRAVLDPGIPVTQSCDGRRVFPRNSARSSVLYSDCANTKGGSGSVNLVRVAGRLTAAAMFTGSGDDTTKRMCTYSEADKCYTHSILLDGRFREDAEAVLAH